MRIARLVSMLGVGIASLLLWSLPSVGIQACTQTGTPGPDVMNGTAGDDVLCGLGGDDQLRGRGGNDFLRGGPGHDFLSGGRVTIGSSVLAAATR